METANPGSLEKLAILIDADNAQASCVDALLAEVAKSGVAIIRRAYGDWTSSSLASWKAILNQHAIQPVQQFAYTTGKNATDFALIIDAMDILHGNTVSGFWIVSSDSDYTRLAIRLRESGRKVFGFGRRTTPYAFAVACNKFVFMEEFQKPPLAAGQPKPPGKVPPVRKSTRELQADKKLVRLLREAVAATADTEGYALLCAVGSRIQKDSAEFETKAYGYSTLSKLIQAIDLFEIEEWQEGKRKAKHYLRDKHAATV